MYGDNAAVVMNTCILESTLNKKHHSIYYHIMHESIMAKIMQIGKEDTETKIADVFIKLLHTGKKQKLYNFTKINR